MTSHSRVELSQQSELDALREENWKLKEAAELIRWLAQTLHQAHHEGPIDRCPRNTCRAAMTYLDVPTPPLEAVAPLG